MVILYALVITAILILVAFRREIRGWLTGAGNPASKCPRCGHKKIYHNNGRCLARNGDHKCWCEL